MRKFSKKQYLVAGAAALVVAAGAGTAFAYWTTSGTGDGSGSTGTTTNWSVAFQTTTGATSLSPGGPSQTVNFTITNPDSGHAALNSVALTVANPSSAFSVSDGTDPACTAADFTITDISLTDGTTVHGASGPTVSGTALYDVAHNGTITGSATLTMTDGTGNQNSCKSQTIPVHAVVG